MSYNPKEKLDKIEKLERKIVIFLYNRGWGVTHKIEWLKPQYVAVRMCVKGRSYIFWGFGQNSILRSFFFTIYKLYRPSITSSFAFWHGILGDCASCPPLRSALCMYMSIRNTPLYCTRINKCWKQSICIGKNKSKKK